jgi:dimethylargininase
MGHGAQVPTRDALVETVPALKSAIVRIPGRNFAEGLTTVDLGVPDYESVLQQHAHYCEALVECGLHVTTLDPDLRHPDSTFVEDTAILTARGAVLTAGRGQPRRRGGCHRRDDP